MSTDTALVPFTQPHPRRARLWQTLGRTCRVIGLAIGRAGDASYKAIASAYKAIDPDVRLHIAQLPIVGLSMLMPRNGEVLPLPDDGYRPLIFVHGLGGRPGNFVAMQAYFRARGRTRVYLVDLTGAKSFDEMTAQLRALIEQIVACNRLGSDAKIDVVGHSLGGLVARLALRDESVASRVRILVTLGAPHSGTYLARFAATQVTLDLRPDSKLVRDLDQDLCWGLPKGVRFVAYWSRADVFILPADGACLPGAENIEMPGFTHYSYLLKPQSWRTVFEALRDRTVLTQPSSHAV